MRMEARRRESGYGLRGDFDRVIDLSLWGVCRCSFFSGSRRFVIGVY